VVRSAANCCSLGIEAAGVAIEYACYCRPKRIPKSMAAGQRLIERGAAIMERRKASDYPQELLDLFHEYQHGDITRRDFFERASKFAVGGLTVAAIFESLRPNYAWAQQVPKDDKRIKTETATVSSPQGNGSIKGYLAKPAGSGKHPAVLVVHENRGLNPYIED